MKNLTKKLIQISMITSFVFAVSFLLAPSFTFAATPACGSTIASDTTFDSDMTCPGDGIIIGADNITLDCSGHSITGPNNFTGQGIHLNSVNGVTVKNCSVSGFRVNMLVYQGSNNTISNNTIANNPDNYGLRVVLSNGNTITGNNISSNWYGIDTYSANNNLVENNTINSNTYGLSIQFESANNNVNNNTIKSNVYGVYNYYNTINNSFANNTISENSHGIYIDNTSSGLTFLNNIITNNTENVSNSGSNNNFSPALVAPLACGDTITSDTTLTADLLSCPGDGLAIGADNITLDCAGHTLSGPGSGTYGINNTVGYDNVTVKNCNVTGNALGIAFVGSSNSTIVNSTSTGNTHYGIVFSSGSNNNIINNYVAGNGNSGIGIVNGSNNNTVTGNTARSNYHGININSSLYNNVSANDVGYGNFNGIYINGGASNNDVNNNTAISNANTGIILESASNNTITSNTTNSNPYGIYLASSGMNTFTSNTVNLNYLGFTLTSSQNNTLDSNTVNSNTGQGIYVIGSTNNTLNNNTVSSNSNIGINLYTSSSNILNSNNVNLNYFGITLQNSADSNTLTGNTANQNTNGIYLTSVSNNTLTSNTANSNNVGFTLDSSSNNNLISNTATSNSSYGIYLLGQSLSNIISNTVASLSGAYDIFIDPNLALDSNTLTNNTGTSNATPADTDNDGVLDTADQCPTVVGTADKMGCPFAVVTKVDMQTVDQQKSGVCGYDKKGKPLSECKNLLSGSEVRVFNREDANFVSLYKSKRPEKTKLDLIFEGGIAQVGTCTTDASGVCTVGTNTSGKYLMIAKYVDGVNTVYTGKYQNFKRSTESSEEEDDSDSDAKTVRNTLLTKKLHFIKTISPKGVVSYKAGTISVFTGSQLSVLYPEAPVWEGATELYPFVMTSDSDWTVDVCLQVPTGYSLKGVQDVNGTVLSTTNCSQSLVSGTPVVVLFSLADIGSPEPKIAMTLTTTHKGKKTKTDVTLDGIRRKSKDAGEKDLKGEINKKKAEEAANKPKINKDDKVKMEETKKKIIDLNKKSQDMLKGFKEEINKHQAYVPSTPIWAKVGSFFGAIGKGITNFASVLTSFLFR